MNRVIRITPAALLVALLATAFVGAEEQASEPTGGGVKGEAKAGKPVPDSELGLARGPVLATSAPDPVRPDTADPGSKPLLPRWNAVAPPMIPHGISDFLPIERSANACVDCHLIEEKGEGDPTPLPASHLSPPAKEGDASVVTGARWICVSCHVPLTDAKPLPASSRVPKSAATGGAG